MRWSEQSRDTWGWSLSASRGSSIGTVAHHGYFCDCSTDTSLSHSKGSSPPVGLSVLASLDPIKLWSSGWEPVEISWNSGKKMAEGDLPPREQEPPVWAASFRNPLAIGGGVSYHKGTSLKSSSSTHPPVVAGEHSHKTETFSLSPVSTWLSLT